MATEKNRVRRTMMFLSAQKPALLKDAYIFDSDSVIFDLEDAVAENQKDSARFSLYQTLSKVDYGDTERFVRINALDTPHWQEDVRVCVAGGADGIRIPKCDSAQQVHDVEALVETYEKQYGLEVGSTLLMAAIESPLGVINAFEICKSSDRLIGVALSGGDYRRCLQTKYYPSGNELFVARGQIVIAARAAGVQCFDTVYTDFNDMDGFVKETELIKEMGFDGKSIVTPKQIEVAHKIFAPTEKEILQAERVVEAVRENAKKGVGIFTLDGQMLDIAFVEGAERIIAMAKKTGQYKGDL